MSTNYVLIVLMPNGRREKVHVTPNTSILQVLEDVCRKQQLNSSEWDLKHYNRIVELANSVRFSGLANNATLEMVQSNKPRVENMVKLGVQLESGKRLMHQFSPTQTLWEVLLYWQTQGENIFPQYTEAEELISTQPVCIYMRQEVVGQDQLQTKTLRSLGLTHGSAIIRLIHRSESQLRHQANVSAPLSRQTTSQEVLADDEDWGSPAIKNDSPMNAPRDNSASPPPKVFAQAQAPGAEIRRNVPSALARNETVAPRAPPTVSAPAPPSTVTPMEEDVPVQDLTITNTNTAPTSEVMATDNRRKIAVDGQLHILGEHDAILYYADDVSRHVSSTTIPDSFYDVTMADVNAMWRDLQEKRMQLENAPLQTASARSLERDTTILRNLKEHPVTIVRIRFNDRYVLQGKFRTMDTIAAVENFVRKFLENPDLSFYLFTTPPKTILPSTSRLVEETLVGSAVIYFGCDGKIDQFLKPDLYELVSCPDAVQEYMRTNSEGGNPKPPIDQTTLNMATTTSHPSHSSDQQQPSTSTGGAAAAAAPNPPRHALVPGSSRLNDRKVPKWFKPGK